MVECLPITQETMVLIPSTERKEKVYAKSSLLAVYKYYFKLVASVVPVLATINGKKL